MGNTGPDEEFRVTDRRRAGAGEAPGAGGSHASPGAGHPGSASAERSLESLFLMLGRSALLAMGEGEDPSTGREARDLGAAEAMIDLLLLLREKTEGHRTPQESQLLGDLVYDLQLRYVAVTRSRS